MSDLRIVQLYPTLLGITGDRGNVDVLATRSRMAGHEPEIVSVHPGDESPTDADIVVIGNGPLSAMRSVHDDLEARAGWLHAHVKAGGVLFAVGGGAELISERVSLQDGNEMTGLGMLPVTVARTRARKVGYVISATDVGELIGFEDHASEWTLPSGGAPEIHYGKVTVGNGSFAFGGTEERGEAIWVGTVCASNIQGPALPLNPLWADDLLAKALAHRGGDYQRNDRHSPLDQHADAARSQIKKLALSKNYSVIQL